ncbi:MAG: DsbA family protein [Nitrospiraceae bacterium]
MWYVLDPGFRTVREASGTASDVPTDEFGRRVRAYLLDNPEVIVEAMQGLEARQRAAAETEAQTILTTRADEVFRDPASPVGGNPQGDVTLVEFFDYNCPYCRRVAPVMAAAEAADPKLRIVYKEFPILGPNSVFAAKAAFAAQRQGRYVPFHRALMQAKGAVDEDAVLAAAAQVGLDSERLKTDMNDAAIQAAIDRNLELAGVLRINGTPSFVISDQILRGATNLGTLQGLIQRARASQQGEGKL